MNFTIMHDVATHYTTVGSSGRYRLVFINALGTDLRIWHKVAADLAATYQILCYDKRGHGLSGGEHDAFSIDLLTDDLAALLDSLGWKENLVIVGLSVGGLIAQNFAFRFPQKVSGLVLMDTAAKIGTEQSWNERIEAVRQKGLAAIGEAIMTRWMSPAFKTVQPAAYACYRNMLERTLPQAYNATCIALRDSDLTEQTRTLSLPTLVIAGQQDTSTPPDLVQATAQLIAGAQFKTLESCGHLPCLEQPEKTVDLINTFMTEIIHGQERTLYSL